jgi:streptogramin lyase
MFLVRPMLAAALAIAVAGCGQGAGTPSQPAPTASAALATLGSLTLQATVTGFSGPASVVATSDAVWVLSHSAATLVRIDPTTNTASTSIPLGSGYANGLGLAGGRLWTFQQSAGEVVGVDQTSKTIVATAWLITGGNLVRIDAATSKVKTYPLDRSCEATGGAAGGGFVWLADSGGGICKLDAQTGTVVTHGTGAGRGTGMTLVGGSPWLAAGDNGLSIVDPTALTVATAIAPPAPGTFQGATYSIGQAGGDSTIVVGNADGKGGWLRYTGATIGRVTLGTEPAIVLYAGFPADLLAGGVVEGFGSLWVTNFGVGTTERDDLPTP